MGEQAEKVARDFIRQLEDSWNAADGEAFGNPFAEDANFVTIRGERHQGREAIARGHQGIFDTIYKGSRVTYELLQARTLTNDVILAHVKASLDAPSGPLAGKHNSVATLVLAQKRGEWQVAGFHNTLVAPAQ